MQRKGNIVGVRTEQDRARERARDMVTLLMRDDLDGLAGATAEVIADRSAESDLFFPMLVEITDACAHMIEKRAPERGPDAAYVVDVATEDGNELAIDTVPPALRALLRAILARLEQHHDDELFQLRLAARDPELSGRLDALVHGLQCVSALLGEGAARGCAPDWLVR